VAGGLPYATSLEANLIKECWEEAGIPADMARRAVPTGAVTYVAESSRGLKPDTLYCYDLELPADFQPRCTDGEVEAFELWPLERVMETLEAGPSFKLNCNLVIIDFLIRHGYISPDHEDYLHLVNGLHPRLP
jgi:8-oxo-dGTP pyrophosphatase MutT (NUDIX family)